MKSIISGAVIATAIVASLTFSSKANPVNRRTLESAAVSDTGKMAGNKMKMDKKMDKMEKKKTSATKKDKMKMEKMSKDTRGKM